MTDSIETIPESGVLRPSEQAWAEAKRREAIIAPLAAMAVVPADAAREAAATLGLTQRTVYALLKRYRASGGLLASLAPNRPSGGRGKGRLPAAAERIISTTIAEMYLTRQRRRVEDVVGEVVRRCAAAGLRAPSPNTVRERIRRLRADEVVRRRHGRDAARRLTPVHGSHPAVAGPLDQVQIDHTKVDLMVVDAHSRRPLGRPYITVAIDVFSRCIAGFCLTLEPPSATSVGLCLVHAVLGKEDYLQRLEVEGEWPVWGKPKTIHVDNAAEFQSEALTRGCEQHGIRIEYRPVGQPHFGGIIERLIGTLMGRVHGLPGTTYSSVQERGDYDAEGNAALTLRELERWLTLCIVGVYHNEVHATLMEPPIARYKAGFEVLNRPWPPRVQNAKAVLVDFLPIERRTIQRHGFVLDHIVYYSNALQPWIAERDRGDKFLIRRNPLDLSRVYVLDPSGGHYLEVPYRTLSNPAITLWEHREALERVRREGRARVDEQAIFRAVLAMRELERKAATDTKSARRRAARRAHLPPLSSNRPVSVAVEGPPEAEPPSGPVRRFDDIEEW